MATLNLRNPNGYDGSPGTQYKQGIVRFATQAEASEGTANNVAISPATAQASTALDFASPPVLGFGSTTPRPVHGTTIDATSTITAATTLTATLGNITATNGNLVLGTAGNKLVINAATPTTSSVGTTAAMIGGAVTITSSAITAASKIIFSRRTLGTVMGNVSITAQAGGSATLTSDAVTETSTFDYLIIN
jgi:hypothetical protein